MIVRIKSKLREIIDYPFANSAQYISFLKKKGMTVGAGTVFYDPKSNTIDLSNPKLITLGDNVRITHGVVILTHDYSWSVLAGVYGEALGGIAPVNVGSNVFIGTNAIVLKGVSIGSNVIIGAGSVVTRDIPSNVVCAGNPAKVISSLDAYYQKKKKESDNEFRYLCQQYKCGKLGAEVLREYEPMFMDHKTPSIQKLLSDTGYLRCCNDYYENNGRNYYSIDNV